jgi:hypothetical protein
LCKAVVVWALDKFPHSYLLLVPIRWTSVAVFIERIVHLAIPVSFVFVFILFALVGVEEIATTAPSVSTEIITFGYTIINDILILRDNFMTFLFCGLLYTRILCCSSEHK